MKKYLKYIVVISGILFALLYSVVLFFDSDYYEARRLKNEIENDFNISLEAVPVIIGREVYGWAEEGGDRAILNLNNNDCIKISTYLNNESLINENSEYFKMFKKYNLIPSSVLRYHKSNSHGDFTDYVLDIENCNLFRQYHFE